MSSPPFHVRYTTRRGDYVAMTAAITKASWRRSLLMFGLWLLAVMVISLLVAGDLERGMRALRIVFTGRMEMSYYVVMAGSLGLVLLGSWIGTLMAALIYRHNAIADRELNFTITDKGIEGGADDLQSQFRWSAIRHAIETDRHIFLTISKREAMILPKRAIAPSELDALRAFLRQRVASYEER